jgi:methylated-DNA-[protein]-cysteine S-methyltransferase
MMASALVPTPLGVLSVRAEDDEIVAIQWLEGPRRPVRATGDSEVLRLARRWLDDYFAGHFRPVSFPLRAEGTHFQREVWRAIAAVPVGQTAR